MPLYEDTNGVSEDRPSTEQLVEKHFPTTTYENALDHAQRLLERKGPLPADKTLQEFAIYTNASSILSQNERRRANRAEVRKRIIPIIQASQQGVEYFLPGESIPLFTTRGLEAQQMRLMDRQEVENVAYADFPTLRHFIVELRQSMLLLMTAGMSKAWVEYPDKRELADLSRLLSEREDLETPLSPETALQSVLMASFGTPVSFYWNALNAMFERSLMQHREDLSADDINHLIMGEHQIVDTITQKSMVHFRLLEDKIASEPVPNNLTTLVDQKGTNMWNPDMVWLSGKPGAKDRRLEFSESMFQELRFEASYDPVTCSARGKPMEWFQKLFERMVHLYVKPLVPELNILAIRSLLERDGRKSS